MNDSSRQPGFRGDEPSVQPGPPGKQGLSDKQGQSVQGQSVKRWFADLAQAGGIEVLGGTALFVVFFYQANPRNLAGWIGPLLDAGRLPWAAHLASFLLGLVLLVAVPALWWRLGRRGSLDDVGFGLGDVRFGLAAAGLAALLVTPLLYVNAGDPAFQQTYPLVKEAGASTQAFLVWEAMYLLYYVAWEAFFRGFWLLGLEDRMGAMPALLLQTAVSTVAHLHRPEPETMAALAAGLGFGWLALRARSFWYLVLLHWYIGMATDLFCLVRSP